MKIAARAFSQAPSVKQLTIKSVRLTSVKNCLKGSNATKVTARCWLTKALRAKFGGWFTKQGGKKGVKFAYKPPV